MDDHKKTHVVFLLQGKALLGKLLPRLEEERFGSSRGKGTALEHGVELQTLAASYKVMGTLRGFKGGPITK